MPTLHHYVTKKNATAFGPAIHRFGSDSGWGSTNAERASKHIREAVSELDRLRQHPKNASKDGPWERITQLMQELDGIKDELDRATDRAEDISASAAAK